MDYSEDYVREHLPKEDPPVQSVPLDVQDEVLQRLDFVGGAEGLTARATRWTYAVFSELALGRFRIDESVRPFWPFFGPTAEWIDRVSFGMFDQEHGDEGLGLIIDVPQWSGPGFVVIGHVTFGRLNQARFPIAIRQSELDLHVDHPATGTSACWAQCRRDRSIWGVLTSGHVVGGRRRGRPVTMANGTAGSLIRNGFQPIDAAFVELSSPRPVTSPLPVLYFPALSMPATVHCQSGKVNRTIVEVTNNCGVVHTRSVGMLIYFDKSEAPGDSGALVTVGGGNAVGIYKGSIQVPGPPAAVRGVAQNFEQAIYALQVTPFI